MKLSRKNLGRVATTFLATAMLASLTAVPAMAANGVSGGGTPESKVTTIPIGKTITTDGHSYAPNETYTFIVEGGAAGNYMIEENNEFVSKAVLAGATGDLNVSTTESKTNTGEDPAASYTLEDATITVNENAFLSKTPGIYHYVVTEKVGTTTGMTYDTSVYDLFLYVMNGPIGVNDHYVGYAVAVEQVVDTGEGSPTNGQLIPGTEKAEKIAFVNDYDSSNQLLHDITVTKRVEGSMGDKVNDEFTFTVSVDGEANESFYVEYKTSANAQVTKASVTTGQDLSIPGIKHDGVITIYGLDADDKFEISETSAAGYTTYVDMDYQTGDTHDSMTDSDKKVTTGENEAGTKNWNIAFYNVKDASAPTGIAMDIAPYALPVVIAAAACFVFLRKRNED